jgi:hypothetical protein
MGKNQDDRMAQLEEIYLSLPKVHCLGKCQLACGPIPLFPVEVENVKGKGHALPKANEDLVCSKLSGVGTCSMYRDRPLICRLFGAAEGLECPYGCKRDRALSPQEAEEITNKIHALKTGNPVVGMVKQ